MAFDTFTYLSEAMYALLRAKNTAGIFDSDLQVSIKFETRDEYLKFMYYLRSSPSQKLHMSGANLITLNMDRLDLYGSKIIFGPK